MKNIVVLSIIFMLFCSVALSQESDHKEGGGFSKKVEYNVIAKGMTEDQNMYNLESKTIIDRILFGIRNSYVEFVFRGSAEGINEILAFRIVKSSQSDSFQMEVTRMPNVNYVYRNIEQELSPKTKRIDIPYKMLESISPEVVDMIKKHNGEANMNKFKDDLFQPYRPKSDIYIISKGFADKLHGKMLSLIDVFKSEGVPPFFCDGYNVTFRCVVEDELWTLQIHIPQRRALKLSEICVQIIKDSDKGEIDESKYIKLLDEIKM